MQFNAMLRCLVALLLYFSFVSTKTATVSTPQNADNTDDKHFTPIFGKYFVEVDGKIILPPLVHQGISVPDFTSYTPLSTQIDHLLSTKIIEFQTNFLYLPKQLLIALSILESLMDSDVVYSDREIINHLSYIDAQDRVEFVLQKLCFGNFIYKWENLYRISQHGQSIFSILPTPARYPHLSLSHQFLMTHGLYRIVGEDLRRKRAYQQKVIIVEPLQPSHAGTKPSNSFVFFLIRPKNNPGERKYKLPQD